MVKRGVDVLFALVLLVLAMPFLVLACVVIRVSSPGPVFFRQQRMGRNFRPFQILKLRTMAHAEAGLAYTLGPDVRITPLGRWLRRTKLDELPQLWNVLRGEMSLVGPRPVLPELTDEFRLHYRLLLRVRPGLTDPASLKYSQEARLLAGAADPMRYFKTVVTPDKIRISLEYLERADLWSDLRILAMTAVICCLPRLSRLYGQVPPERVYTPYAGQNLLSMPVAKPAPTPPARPANPPAEVFVPELAHLAASGENPGHAARWPWNPAHTPVSKLQSTPQSAEGRIMHL